MSVIVGLVERIALILSMAILQKVSIAKISTANRESGVLVQTKCIRPCSRFEPATPKPRSQHFTTVLPSRR